MLNTFLQLVRFFCTTYAAGGAFFCQNTLQFKFRLHYKIF